jgi:hypothetical protein
VAVLDQAPGEHVSRDRFAGLSDLGAKACHRARREKLPLFQECKKSFGGDHGCFTPRIPLIFFV